MTSANLPEKPVVRVYRPPTAASTAATSTTGGFTVRDFWRIVRGRLGLIITVLVVMTALFAGLWADNPKRFSQLIVALVHKRTANETVRRIERITGPLKDRSDVLLIVQDVFYCAGAIAH